MLDLDDTQSGSDLDINDLYDESDSDMSDLGDENVAMEKPHEEHVPIEELWKAMNLYVSQDAKSEDVIPSQ